MGQLNSLRTTTRAKCTIAASQNSLNRLSAKTNPGLVLLILTFCGAILACECMNSDQTRANLMKSQIITNEHGVNYNPDQIKDSSDPTDSAAVAVLTDVLIKKSPNPPPTSSSHQLESLSSSSLPSSTSPSHFIKAKDLDILASATQNQPSEQENVEEIGNHNHSSNNGTLMLFANKSKRHVLEADDTAGDIHDEDSDSYHKVSEPCRNAVRACLEQMPRSPMNAIPTTYQGLNNSCRAFGHSVNCFNNISSQCFTEEHRHHLIINIHAEYEILKFLCYNESVRDTCLSKRNCYSVLAGQWNRCVKESTAMVLHLQMHAKPDELCCIRATLTQCVAGNGNGNGFNSTQHLLSMSNTFSDSILREFNLTVGQCVNAKADSCKNISKVVNKKGHALNDLHLNDDTGAARSAQSKRNSMQDQYPFEYDDDEEYSNEDHEDNDSNHHHHHHNGDAMTKLSSAKNAGGTDGKSTTTGRKDKKPSSKCTDALQKCINQIPPMPDAGIPSTVQGVKNACRAFHNGTECVNKVAKDCLTEGQRQQINNSILGAYETFTFLCNDESFRTAYLHHGDCYNKISKHWDNCVKKFISALKQLKDAEKSMEICCLRIAFLQCVMDVTNRYCDQNATQFLRLLGETLIRTTLHGHTPKQCLTVKPEHCPLVQSSSSRLGLGLGSREGFTTVWRHRFAWILGRVILSLTMMDLVTFYYTQFIII